MYFHHMFPTNRIPRRQAIKVMFGASAVAATGPFASAMAVGDSTQAQRSSVVLNPYDGIDWQTCGRHKAALHLHTLQSDGYHCVADVVDAYRNAGFSVISLTDHDWNRPNARIESKELPPEKASPHPKPPFPTNFPANPTWPWPDYGCPSPGDLGVIGIQGNELTFRHHINSYFSDYGVWYTRTGNEAPYGGIVDANGQKVWEDDQLRAIRKKGGLAIINHPGISDTYSWWERKPLSWYVDRFQEHPANCLIGLEVANNEPKQVPYDEGLWDQLLARFMPQRPIWGFGSDDMHQMEDASQSYTIFFLEELTESSVRKAMLCGRFCVCTSTKKINYRQEPADVSIFPKIAAVEIDETMGTIRLEVTDCDQVRWISAPESLEPVEDYRTSDGPWPLGRVVHVGGTLNYRQVAGIHNYVRAELCRSEGQHTHRTLTSPFGIAVRQPQERNVGVKERRGQTLRKPGEMQVMVEDREGVNQLWVTLSAGREALNGQSATRCRSVRYAPRRTNIHLRWRASSGNRLVRHTHDNVGCWHEKCDATLMPHRTIAREAIAASDCYLMT